MWFGSIHLLVSVILARVTIYLRTFFVLICLLSLFMGFRLLNNNLCFVRGFFQAKRAIGSYRCLYQTQNERISMQWEMHGKRQYDRTNLCIRWKCVSYVMRNERENVWQPRSSGFIEKLCNDCLLQCWLRCRSSIVHLWFGQ